MELDLDASNEQEVLWEKIINDIHAVFLKDTELSSFEIIPAISHRNKSPVVHVEHNLGLESWCIKHVYDHAHKILLPQRRQLSPQNNQQNHHQQRFLQYSNSDMIVKYLNVALLINPDVSTFWNMRRQLMQKNRLNSNREFQFSAIILTKKPKSSEAFAYRRWLFSFQSAESIDWPLEIGICDRCADRSPSNYHAWSHRQWVLKNAPFLIRSELMLSEKFMRKHISDYSSYYYRQTVIARAYEMCYYDEDELLCLSSLRELICYYLIADVNNAAEILQIMLPGVDQDALDEQRLKSFLFCCNLAAHDMILCDEQKNLYNARESFEHHRRASLKFIVEQCVHLLLGELPGPYIQPQTPAQKREFNAQLRDFDYASVSFLAALKRSEGLLGEQHRKWCSVFLGFDYKAT